MRVKLKSLDGQPSEIRIGRLARGVELRHQAASLLGLKGRLPVLLFE